MFDDIFQLIFQIIGEISGYIYYFVSSTFGDYTFNIYLFSDTGWFNTPIPFAALAMLIFGIFMFIFILRLLWNGTKKFINMVFGVFKL